MASQLGSRGGGAGQTACVRGAPLMGGPPDPGLVICASIPSARDMHGKLTQRTL